MRLIVTLGLSYLLATTSQAQRARRALAPIFASHSWSLLAAPLASIRVSCEAGFGGR
jgi:hypothetical protein